MEESAGLPGNMADGVVLREHHGFMVAGAGCMMPMGACGHTATTGCWWCCCLLPPVTGGAASTPRQVATAMVGFASWNFQCESISGFGLEGEKESLMQ